MIDSFVGLYLITTLNLKFILSLSATASLMFALVSILVKLSILYK